MSQKGFTLVELILVIILLGILSAISIPRLFSKSTFEQSFQRAEFVNALAWVRNRSITTQCTYEVRLTENGWSTLRDNSCSNQNIEIGCSSEVYNFNISVLDGIDVELASSEPYIKQNLSPVRLIFTHDGRIYQLNSNPKTLGCSHLPPNPMPPNTMIPLSNGTLTIDGGTAYVDVQQP